MRDYIEARVEQARVRKAQMQAIHEALDELLLEGRIRWTGEYRNGSPVYVAVELEEEP